MGRMLTRPSRQARGFPLGRRSRRNGKSSPRRGGPPGADRLKLTGVRSRKGSATCPHLITATERSGGSGLRGRLVGDWRGHCRLARERVLVLALLAGGPWCCLYPLEHRTWRRSRIGVGLFRAKGPDALRCPKKKKKRTIARECRLLWAERRSRCSRSEGPPTLLDLTCVVFFPP